MEFVPLGNGTINNRVCILSASTFSQEGGIQRVTRMLLRYLRENWHSAAVDLFSLHDRSKQTHGDALARDIQTGMVSYRPCDSSRLRYANASLRHLIGAPPALLISEHAHLSVLPWMARPIGQFKWVSFVYYLELQHLGILRRKALQKSDLIIAISDFTAQETRRVLGKRCPPLAVCHLGLPPEYPTWADQCDPAPAGALTGRRVILIVGRMADATRDKGHEALIRAMPGVVKQVPSALLVIVGRGEDELRLRRLVGQLELDDYVHFAGFVRDPQLPSYYSAAEIFAMPSYAEGFGLVYLEAMFHAKPCIAGNQDAAGEVVADGQTGILVQPGNVGQVQEALLSLLLNPDRARQMGAAGRARLDANFTYDRFASRLDNLLAPYLGEKSIAPEASREAVSVPEG